MSALKPFFLLIQRPLVLFGAIGWFIMATFLVGDLVRHGRDLEWFMDPVFLAVVILSIYSGWIAGSCVLELQQSTFAFLLPRGGHRLLPGFLVFGVGVVLAAVLLSNAASPAPPDAVTLFAFGLAAYVTGASIRDPQSAFLTGLGIALFLLLLLTSGQQALLAQEHPVLLLLLSAALLSTGLFRLFGQAAIRSRSVTRGRPVLNFSAAVLSQAAQQGQIVHGPVKSKWRPGYLGKETRAWLSAARYETYGGQRMRNVLKSIMASWGLFLVLLFEAWEYSADLGFWKSYCWVVHDGLMRSPIPPLTGEHSGAFIMVAVIIIIGGASMALWRPVALAENFLHPVSRRQKAELQFAGGFFDMAILLFAVAPILLLLGHGAGLLAGITPRFDYLPFFFRVILVTLALMPFAYWGGLRMRSTRWRNDRYSMVGISFGMSVFSVSAMLLVFLSEGLFSTPWIELSVLLTAVLLSRLLFYGRLHVYYQRADLC